MKRNPANFRTAERQKLTYLEAESLSKWLTVNHTIIYILAYNANINGPRVLDKSPVFWSFTTLGPTIESHALSYFNHVTCDLLAVVSFCWQYI